MVLSTMRRYGITTGALALLLVAVSVVIMGCADPLAGTPGLGDPYLPKAGNGGYDALHYDLDLVVDPASGRLEGQATIAAQATQQLASFDLDFTWTDDLDSVSVDGAPADWKLKDGELKVSCPSPLAAGQEFEVSVSYSGVPESIVDASSFVSGWQRSGDVSFTIDEPEGAATWFPANDHPSDKATYSYHITVPKPYVATANGVLVATEDRGVDQTFVWEMKQPQASYLASVTVAQYVVKEGESPNGVPLRSYFDQSIASEAEKAFVGIGEMLDYFATAFGAYPFEVYGVVATSAETGAAMENQTLSLYGLDLLVERMSGDSVTRDIYVSHELAHQWFGDSLTPARWSDIWLNEGFATYASWLWLAHDRGPELLENMIGRSRSRLKGERFAPLSDPGVDGLFTANVYERGALTLHALRLTVGDQVFFAILRQWVARYQHGTVTTAGFISLVKELVTDVPGEQLDALFGSWLNEKDLPELPEAGS